MLFTKKNARCLLVFLLSMDAAFIAIDILRRCTPYFHSALWSIEKDLGYPEIFQYVKFFLICILLLGTAGKRRRLGYAAWAVVFFYFLLDDALEVHEILGGRLGFSHPFLQSLGYRPLDMGELMVSVGVGLGLMSLLVLFYLRGDQAFRKTSKDLVLLVGILAFFGVGVDMAKKPLEHLANHLGLDQVYWLVEGVIEDGGESLAASLLLWYAFLLPANDEIKLFGIRWKSGSA